MQRKHLVLIVDDDADLRRVLRWSLEALGYEVDEVAEGAQAVSLVRTLRPDAVLMDIIMPDTGGLEVLAQLKSDADLADIPVLFLSAAADLTTKAAGFELGAQDYILKSTDLREVDLRLRAAIKGKRRREHLVEAARSLAREREQLAVAVMHDPLTGLMNRRALEQHGRGQLEIDTIKGQPTTLLMADIDHFKQVNDRLGHQAGDQVLQTVAQFIKASLRDMDLCVRFGGEEFAIILPGADRAAGLRIAERLRRGVELLRIYTDGEAVPVTISIGVATCPEDADTFDALLEVADSRLYLAKQTGRNRAV